MASTPLKFEDFELDPSVYELRFKGSPIRLERIPMELLLLLSSRPGELVSRAEIIERIWGKNVFLDTENGINTAIRKVRVALQDDPESPRFVVTVAGRGYRFIAPVARETALRVIPSAEKGIARVADEKQESGRDAASELKWIAATGSQRAESSHADVMPPPISRRRARERIAWGAAGAIASVAVALIIGFALRAPKPPQPLRVSAEIGADATLFTEYGPSAILSPDGTRLAFVATGSDHARHIYIRPLDQLQATALAGTENARDHFFSPDGQWLGFFADGKLKKVSTQGGAAVTLCEAPDSRGGSWSEDGAIVYSPEHWGSLFKVSSAGGPPEALTSLDKQTGEQTQRWPQVLPGGKAVLFTSSGAFVDYEDAEVAVYSMTSGQRKTLLRGATHARYVSTGHLVYTHKGTLFAVPFNLQRLQVTGQPAPVLEDVVAIPIHGGAQYSISDTGILVYVAGRSDILNVSIFWMDRKGKFTPLRETPAVYYDPVFSPDGKRLAIEIYDGKRSDIWVYDWKRDAIARLTSGGRGNYSPVWTPDGQRITYFSAEGGGGFAVYWKHADGTGEPQRLAETKAPAAGGSWRPDGKVLAFTQINSGAPLEIYTLSLEGEEKSGWKFGTPRPFLKNSFSPAFSPDGRWLAYSSEESGSLELYVQPFPGPGGKWQVSTGGGLHARWSRDGKELLYRTYENQIMVAGYSASKDTFQAARPRLWSPGRFTERHANYNFDMYPDGRRAAVLKASGSGETEPANRVRLVLNFFDDLRRKVPARQ